MVFMGRNRGLFSGRITFLSLIKGPFMAKKKTTRKKNGSGTAKKIKAYFINAVGGGYSDILEVDQGCTVEELFESMMEGQKPQDHLILVNRAPAAADEVIQDGDRISITPIQVKGS